MSKSQATESAETSLHLLFHALEILQSNADQSERQQIFDALSKTTNRITDKPTDAGHHQAIVRLLNCIREEIGGEGKESESDSETELTKEESNQTEQPFAQRLAKQWDRWKPVDYQVVPFAQPTTLARRSVELSVSTGDDPFLREYRWSVLRDPGRLKVESVLEPQSWSIPGSLTIQSGFSGPVDVVTRSGSVLVMRSPGRLVAVSVVDRRILWSRRVNSYSSHKTDRLSVSKFDRDTVRSAVLPVNTIRGHCRVIGTGDRWIALMTDHAISVLDLLTGHTAWLMRSKAGWGHAVATDNAVLASEKGSGKLYVVSRRDGQPIETKIDARLVRNAVAGIRDRAVTWIASDDNDSVPTLVWIDPISGKVDRVIRFDNCVSFQFPDDEHVVGFSESESFRLVNLKSGKILDGDYSLSGEVDSSSAKVWRADEVFMFLDSANCYVSPIPFSDDGPVSQPFSRRLAIVGQGIRAVSRQSGQLAWHHETRPRTLVASDQPYLPVLIMMANESQSKNPLIAAIQKNRFRGFLKTTGNEIFDETIPSRFALRSVGLKADSDQQAVDIEVYGNHVRVEPVDEVR